MNVVLIFLMLSIIMNIILVFDSKQLFKKLREEQKKNKALWEKFRMKEYDAEYYEDIIKKIKDLV